MRLTTTGASRLLLEFRAFLSTRKKWWVTPVVLVTLLWLIETLVNR